MYQIRNIYVLRMTYLLWVAVYLGDKLCEYELEHVVVILQLLAKSLGGLRTEPLDNVGVDALYKPMLKINY